MIKGEDVKSNGTSDITLGTTYEINKNLVEKYEKILSKEELEEKKQVILNYLQELNNFYFMLLCHERRDYTLFRYTDNKNKEKDIQTIEEMIECLLNRGQIKGIDITKDGIAIEIWISINGESFAYYFFPYDEGVIEI
jgi:hypothetical protein